MRSVGELGLHGEYSHLPVVAEESLDVDPNLTCGYVRRQDDAEYFIGDGTVKPRDNREIVEIPVDIVGRLVGAIDVILQREAADQNREELLPFGVVRRIEFKVGWDMGFYVGNCEC